MYASNYFEEKICNLLRGQSIAAPSDGLYLGLFLSNPGDDGQSGQEVTYTGYARQAVNFTAPTASGSGLMVQNSAALTFAEASSSVGQVTHIGVFDASTTGAGNMWLYAQLSSPLNVVSGVTPIIRAESVKFTLSGGLSTYYKTAVLNTLRGTTLSGFNPYMAFFSSDPGASGAELSGEGYARTALSFEAPSQQSSGSAQTKNASEVLSPVAGENWGTLAFIAVMDAASNGNVFLSSAVEPSYTMTKGSAAGYHAGDLKFSVN